MKLAKDKHPIVYRLWNVVRGSGMELNAVADEARLHRSTLRALFFGKTFCPKFSTVEDIYRAVKALDEPIVRRSRFKDRTRFVPRKPTHEAPVARQ